MNVLKSNLAKFFTMSLLVFILPTAQAGIISTYNFIGQCHDCYENNDGSFGQATATLELVDYTLGETIELSNFVAFTYLETDLFSGFTINSINNIDSLSGSLLNHSFEITVGQFFFESISFTDPLAITWETGCVFGVVENNNKQCLTSAPETSGGTSGGTGGGSPHRGHIRDFGSSPNWSLLVVNTPEPVIPTVPEPATLAIFTLAILGLISRKFKQPTN